jgi:DNA-binding NarL/FixJ family response regulator
MKTRLLLADDHVMLRQALRGILEREPDIEVVAEASNGADALRLAKELTPDVIVMDISMSGVDGINATRRLVASDAGVKVLALSTHAERHFIMQMLRAGVRGYVVKTAGITELLKAVRAISQGQTYLCQEAAKAMPGVVHGNANGEALGRREREVLTLVAEGRTSKEIGAKLLIAKDTVEVHRSNIIRKLSLHTVAELTQYAIREGLITI